MRLKKATRKDTTTQSRPRILEEDEHIESSRYGCLLYRKYSYSILIRCSIDCRPLYVRWFDPHAFDQQAENSEEVEILRVVIIMKG